jgi:hypothetical protein
MITQIAQRPPARAATDDDRHAPIRDCRAAEGHNKKHNDLYDFISPN